MSLPRQTLLLLYTLPLATIPITYLLHIHPFSPFSPIFRHRSQLHEHIGVPPSFLHSRTLGAINPRAYAKNAMCDTRIITLPSNSIKGLSDEEVLARFTKGFFGGWTFLIEKCVLSFAAWSVGYRVAGVGGSGFPGVPKTGQDLPSFPLRLSRSSLPHKYSRIAGGNFMLLDQSNTPVSSSEKPELATGSFVDFAFGDSRGTFSGCHRFEVLRTEGVGEKVDGEIKVIFSSIACNPTNEEHKYAGWLHAFHVLYARVLFWDGMREVLK